MKVSIEWRNTSALMTPAIDNSFSAVFNTSSYNKLYRLVGIAPQFRIPAMNLELTSAFYQRMNAALERAPGDKQTVVDTFVGDRSYRLFITDPNIKIYSPGIAAIYNSAELAAPDGYSFKDLIRLRARNKTQVIYSLNKVALDAINGCIGTTGMGYSYSAKPLYLIELPADTEVASYIRLNRTELVGLLIGNIDYESMNDDIATNIIERCTILNMKSVHHYLLASKQGIVIVRRESSAAGDWQSNGLFHRTSACFELASVSHKILSLYPQLHAVEPQLTDQALLLTSYLVRNSTAIFNESYSTRTLWELLVEELALASLLDLVAASNTAAAKALSVP